MPRYPAQAFRLEPEYDDKLKALVRAEGATKVDILRAAIEERYQHLVGGADGCPNCGRALRSDTTEGRLESRPSTTPSPLVPRNNEESTR